MVFYKKFDWGLVFWEGEFLSADYADGDDWGREGEPTSPRLPPSLCELWTTGRRPRGILVRILSCGRRRVIGKRLWLDVWGWAGYNLGKYF